MKYVTDYERKCWSLDFLSLKIMYQNCWSLVSDKEDGAQCPAVIGGERAVFVCGCHGAGEPPWLHFSHYSLLSFHTVLMFLLVLEDRPYKTIHITQLYDIY